MASATVTHPSATISPQTMCQILALDSSISKAQDERLHREYMHATEVRLPEGVLPGGFACARVRCEVGTKNGEFAVRAIDFDNNDFSHLIDLPEPVAGEHLSAWRDIGRDLRSKHESSPMLTLFGAAERSSCKGIDNILIAQAVAKGLDGEVIFWGELVGRRTAALAAQKLLRENRSSMPLPDRLRLTAAAAFWPPKKRLVILAEGDTLARYVYANNNTPHMLGIPIAAVLDAQTAARMRKKFPDAEVSDRFLAASLSDEDGSHANVMKPMQKNFNAKNPVVADDYPARSHFPAPNQDFVPNGVELSMLVSVQNGSVHCVPHVISDRSTGKEAHFAALDIEHQESFDLPEPGLKSAALSLANLYAYALQKAMPNALERQKKRSLRHDNHGRRNIVQPPNAPVRAGSTISIQ